MSLWVLVFVCVCVRWRRKEQMLCFSILLQSDPFCTIDEPAVFCSADRRRSLTAEQHLTSYICFSLSHLTLPDKTSHPVQTLKETTLQYNEHSEDYLLISTERCSIFSSLFWFTAHHLLVQSHRVSAALCVTENKLWSWELCRPVHETTSLQLDMRLNIKQFNQSWLNQNYDHALEL